MDPAKDDHRRVRPGGLKAQPQGIADEICHVLHFRVLVVVGQDDGMPFFLNLLNFLLNRH